MESWSHSVSVNAIVNPHANSFLSSCHLSERSLISVVLYLIAISCCLVTHHFMANVALIVDGKKEKTASHVRYASSYKLLAFFRLT